MKFNAFVLVNSSGKTLCNRKGGERRIFEWKTPQGMKTMGLIFPNGPNFFWFSPIFLKKEEVVMKYSFTCPAPCNYEIKIDAQNDDEALKKIMEAGAVHAKKAHPNVPPMTEEKLKNMFRSGMKKG